MTFEAGLAVPRVSALPVPMSGISGAVVLKARGSVDKGCNVTQGPIGLGGRKEAQVRRVGGIGAACDGGEMRLSPCLQLAGAGVAGVDKAGGTRVFRPDTWGRRLEDLDQADEISAACGAPLGALGVDVAGEDAGVDPVVAVR